MTDRHDHAQHDHARHVTDPVCGMSIDPAATGLHSDYHGTRYSFCSRDCQRAFDAEPSRYAQQGQAHDAHRP